MSSIEDRTFGKEVVMSDMLGEIEDMLRELDGRIIELEKSLKFECAVRERWRRYLKELKNEATNVRAV